MNMTPEGITEKQKQEYLLEQLAIEEEKEAVKVRIAQERVKK
jgi:hypothetical protein